MNGCKMDDKGKKKEQQRCVRMTAIYVARACYVFIILCICTYVRARIYYANANRGVKTINKRFIKDNDY